MAYLFELARNRTSRSRLGVAVLLKFFQVEGRFPAARGEITDRVLDYLANQLEVPRRVLDDYHLNSRGAKRDRAQIRQRLGFRQATVQDGTTLAAWLRSEVMPIDPAPEHLLAAARDWCRTACIEPPTPTRLERIVGSALHTFETAFFAASLDGIPLTCRATLDNLLTAGTDDRTRDVDRTPMAELRADPGRPSLDSVLKEVAKLQCIDTVRVPGGVFAGVPSPLVQKYRRRAATEPPRELRRHPAPRRYTLLVAFYCQRRKEIMDGLVDLLIHVVHRIGVRAERKVVKALLQNLRTVHGKTTLLFRIAEVVVNHPDGVIKEVVYPVVGRQTLHDLVREFKVTGAAYQQEVHTTIRSSYGRHYRRMLSPLLGALTFRSNNARHRPVIDALQFLRSHDAHRHRFFSLDEGVPIDGVIKPTLRDMVVETDTHGVERINRITYEIAVLQALRERLRCKEVWVVGADRYRNPDDDLPLDFEVKRHEYDAALNQPPGADAFVARLKRSMVVALDQLNATIPKNPRVRLVDRRPGRIVLTPLTPQPEPVTLSSLKREVTRRWPMTSLLDVLKETDLRVGVTDEFHSASSREVMDRATLQKRLLLSFYGLGTNTGLKRVSASDREVTYSELLHVRRRFIHKDALRLAIARVVNAIFRVRQPEIWGKGTTVCASDSKKFGAWDQNLMTEWHIRYGGRGVMIYWHVEKKSA